MQETLALTVIDTEVFSTVVTGFGNFAWYPDFSALQVGDEVTVKLYADAVGTANNKVFTNVNVTEANQALAGDEVDPPLPLALEAGQTARMGFTLKAGSAPLSIPVRTTNLQTGE